jgi:hypothetical protein
MRFSAMRRLASVVMAVVWSGARLAQPLQPVCPHHAAAFATTAVEEAAGAVASAEVAAPAMAHHAPAHHAYQHASALLSASATLGAAGEAAGSESPAHHPEGTTAPCECAAHCCAAATVAIGATAPTFEIVVATVASVPQVVHRDRAPRQRRAHVQPPATAPPASRVV